MFFFSDLIEFLKLSNNRWWNCFSYLNANFSYLCDHHHCHETHDHKGVGHDHPQSNSCHARPLSWCDTNPHVHLCATSPNYRERRDIRSTNLVWWWWLDLVAWWWVGFSCTMIGGGWVWLCSGQWWWWWLGLVVWWLVVVLCSELRLFYGKAMGYWELM